MTLNRTIRSLLKKRWTSMMVENSRNQGRVGHLHVHLQDNTPVSGVMDYSQTWHHTPQGREYWKRIQIGL